MQTDGVIKHEFVVQTIEWGLRKLRDVQLAQLVSKRHDIEERHFNWEELYESVAEGEGGIIGGGGHYRIVIPVRKRLRFADMKRFADGNRGPNARVYNRPTFGVLLGSQDSVRTRLRQGISEQLRNSILQSLKEAIEEPE